MASRYLLSRLPLLPGRERGMERERERERERRRERMEWEKGKE